MKKKFFIALQVSLVLLSSCTKSGSGAYGSNNNSGSNSTSNTVSIANMTFDPSSTSVNKGTTVTWTNNDNMSHTVTADDNSFTSGNLNKGDTYSHTFSAVGTFAYHCKIHPGMTGQVAVK